MDDNRYVLLITRSLTTGGAERVMAILANGLADMGVNVTLAVMQNKERTYYVNEKVNLVQFDCESRNKIVNSFYRLIKLRKLIKNHQAKTVVAFVHIINFYSLIAALGLKKNVIVSERADASKNKQWYLKWGRKILYPLAYKIVFQTQEAREFFPASIRNKGVVIANPVSPKLPERYEGKRENIVVAVGRLTEQKNFKMTLDAFSMLRSEFRDLQLHIYGEGPYRTKIEEYASSLGISEKVKLLGYVKNIPDKISKAEVYVSSSDYEGISNSMIEAMAVGVPSVVTDCPVGGARMIVNNNENGVLIPVGDTKALYEGMKKILSDKVFANKMSKNAVKIRDTYSVESICKQWNDIIVWDR